MLRELGSIALSGLLLAVAIVALVIIRSTEWIGGNIGNRH